MRDSKTAPYFLGFLTLTAAYWLLAAFLK